ncbi:MAG: hypothetical protein EA374_06620 [Acholeplasmatales bacterium]|nr:MAG: hypothetical protein EA374_06620 [Acholeplasmatales bacterium]
MADIKWLLTLQFTQLRNQYLRDRATRSRTVMALMAIIAFMYLLTRLLYNSFSVDIDATHGSFNAIVFIMFSMVMFWLFFMAFIQGLSTFVKVFYRSQEMNHLVTLPIPFNTLFLFSFLKLIFVSNKAMLILFVPFVATIGLYIHASWWFYVLIVPVFYVMVIIPCSIAVLVALVGLKYLSSKLFSLLTTCGALVLNFAFAFLFTRSDTVFTDFYPRIAMFVERRFILDVFPMTAGARIWMTLGQLETYRFSVLFYFLTTIVTVLISLSVSKRLYYKGWEKNQVIEARLVNRRPLKLKARQLATHHVIVHWIKTEWKMAKRNYDMLIAAISMLSFYILAVLSFTFGDFFSGDTTLEIALCIFVATLFNVMAISLLFLPADLTKDKSLWKQRYWLLKITPLSGMAVLMMQTLMYFLPAYAISLSGLIFYALFAGITLPTFIVSSFSLFIVLLGASLIYVTTEMLSLSAFFERNALLGNIMTFVIPISYAVLTVGGLIVWLAKDYIVNFGVLYDLAKPINLPFALSVAVLAVVSSSLFAYKAFIPVWNKLEIN